MQWGDSMNLEMQLGGGTCTPPAPEPTMAALGCNAVVPGAVLGRRPQRGQGPTSSPRPSTSPQEPSAGTHLLSLQPREAMNAGVSLEERQQEM